MVGTSRYPGGRRLEPSSNRLLRGRPGSKWNASASSCTEHWFCDQAKHGSTPFRCVYLGAFEACGFVCWTESCEGVEVVEEMEGRLNDGIVIA